MAFQECYYALCTGCGVRDITGPWTSREEAADRSYFRSYKHPRYIDVWVLWCSTCDPERCKECDGKGVIITDPADHDFGWHICVACKGDG